MATVYRGEHVSGIGMSAAVKKLHPHLALDSELRARLKVEAQALARLKHPNVVQLFDYVDSGDSCALVTELVEGRTLRAVMNDYAEGPMPVPRAVHLFRQVLAGVAHAHSHGCLHRDLKPTNVMVTQDDRVKVLDFGIANLVDTERLTRTGVSIGTPVYMPPEQFEGMDGLDERADVFSLGVTFWELLAGPGARPIGQKGWRLDAEHVAALESKGVPLGVVDVVQAMVRPDRERRMTSCEEALRALSWACEDSLSAEVPATSRSVELTAAMEERETQPFGTDGFTLKEQGQAPAQGVASRRPLLTKQAFAVLVVLAAGMGLWALSQELMPQDDAEVYSIPAPSLGSTPAAVGGQADGSSPVDTPGLSSIQLQLRSSPPGAWLRLDDIALGRAPTSTRVETRTATYTISAELAGYRPTTVECAVRASDLERGGAECSVQLKKVATKPAGAKREPVREPQVEPESPKRRPDISKIGD